MIFLEAVLVLLVLLVVVPSTARLIARAWFEERNKHWIRLSRIIYPRARKSDSEQ